jgi:hypothetical protein
MFNCIAHTDSSQKMSSNEYPLLLMSSHICSTQPAPTMPVFLCVNLTDPTQYIVNHTPSTNPGQCNPGNNPYPQTIQTAKSRQITIKKTQRHRVETTKRKQIVALCNRYATMHACLPVFHRLIKSTSLITQIDAF